MTRVFLADSLDETLVRRFDSQIDSAALCTAVDVADSRLARRLLADARWRPGTIPVWDRGHARVHQLCEAVAHAQSDPRLAARIHKALVAGGLFARLRRAGLTTSFYEYALEELGASPQQIELDVATDDPYVRDAFQLLARGDSAPGRLRVQSSSLRRGLGGVAREAGAANAWLRLADVRGSRPGGGSPRTAAGDRTILITANAQRVVRQFEPVIELWLRRGWRVVVAYYSSATDSHNAPQALGQLNLRFEEATTGWQPDAWHRARRPIEWRLPDAVMGQSLVSAGWLRNALDAGWLAGLVYTAKQRRLLETVRPAVAFFFAEDVTSLSLQVAAEELGVRTVYVAHGFETPARSLYHFTASASALYGPACAEHNERAPDGFAQRGLVAIGHPAHDVIRQRFERAREQKKPIPGLHPPPHRPHLVLGLAGWGWDLICHLQQERFLQLIAAALPDDAYLVCKLHPGFEEREQCQTALAAQLPADAFRVVGEAEYRTFELIAGCDVAISSERSMVMADALLIGCPTIGIRHPESPLGSGDRAHPGKDFQRTSWIVENAAELREAIVTLTHSAEARGRLWTERQRYLDRFLRADGHAAERMVALAEHLAAGHDADSFTSDALPGLRAV